MRQLTTQTREAMNAYVNDGDQRFYWRATVEYGQMKWFPYDTELSPGGSYGHDRARAGHYSNMLFTGFQVHEIPNIKSGEITQSLDQDIAELTLTLLNTVISPMGDVEEEYTGSEEYDVPGVLSFRRGAPTIDTNRWGHLSETGWVDLLVPDRIVKTYEGYGIDPTVPAGHDPSMYASGVWLIDTVELNDEGDLVLKARDLGRLLNDHIAMPPDIPWDSYPMEWSKIASELVEDRAPTGGEWWSPSPGGTGISATSSNQAYVGAGIDDVPTYVSPHGNVLGHRDLDPLRDTGYWLSTGQTSQRDVVWWEFDVDDAIDIAALRLETFGGPFVIYVSLHDGDGWIGRRKIPYTVTTEDIDLNANIRFVHRERFERSQREDIVLKRRYQGVKKIRLTFTRLRRHPGAKVYPWRAGLKTFKVYKGTFASLGFDNSGHRLKAVGNYADFTDIVKTICAWAGFWWPERDSQRTMNYGRDDIYDVVYSYTGQDNALVKGRAWGSFEQTGTADAAASGVVGLTADQFDKQPLLDAIQVVRNIVGFTFFIDECGGVVWRMPNLYRAGNYLTPSHLETHGRFPTYVENTHEVIDENQILFQYSTTLDSKNLRERIGVAASNGKVGTVIKGYTPYNTGMRRIAVWTDEHFHTNRECRVAADMIAAQQMFSFRKSTSEIKANPAIQLDDQIRIYERITNETFYHYVTGITKTYDAATGKGRYNLDTHWLGERLSDAWVVRVNQLDAFTQAFLNNLGPVG
jgi:hypothetical protein